MLSSTFRLFHCAIIPLNPFTIGKLYYQYCLGDGDENSRAKIWKKKLRLKTVIIIVDGTSE
jgi:hypothetical protein